MGRIIVYGDIHGCLNELIKLREKINIKKGDIEISLGDVINKGPHSKETLKYLKREKIICLLGNNEDKFIRYHLHSQNSKINPVILNEKQFEIYKTLDKESFEFMSTFIHFKKFGELTLLHGGITNSINLNLANKHELDKIIHIRYLDKDEHFLSLDEDKSKRTYFWSEVYKGKEGFIIYGHQPFKKPKKDQFAFGIDTGCVYGNKLSAAIVPHKDEVPMIKDIMIEQVSAKEIYEKKNLY